MLGTPIKRARRGGISLADSTVIAFPKLTHPHAGLLSSEKIERQLRLTPDQIVEAISRPWDECDAARLAIKTRVLCVFLSMGAKMTRAWADGTSTSRLPTGAPAA